MVTAIQARAQLSKDLGDYFASETTALAGAADKLVDSLLIDKGGNNQDHFLTDLTTVWIDGGQASGPVADEERRVDRDTSVLSTGTLDTFRNFSVTLPAGIDYELHRIYSATEKDEAITQALKLVVPFVWSFKTSDVVMVEDQFDYSLAALGFYRNEIHQLLRISNSDSEITVPLHGFDIINGTTLHLFYRPLDGDSLRLRGIGEPTLTSIDAGELLIVSARAAIYLLETSLNETQVDQHAILDRKLTNARNMYTERLRLHTRPAPPKYFRTEAFSRSLIDVDWGNP